MRERESGSERTSEREARHLLRSSFFSSRAHHHCQTMTQPTPPTVYVKPQTWQEQRELWRVMLCVGDPERMKEEVIHSRTVSLETLKAQWEIEKVQIQHRTRMEYQKLINEQRKEEREHELSLHEMDQNKDSHASSLLNTRWQRLRIGEEPEAETRGSDETDTDEEENSNIGGGDPEDYCRPILF